MRLHLSILTLALAASLFASAATFTFTIDGINYETTDDNIVRVIAKTPAYTGDIVIPASVEYGGTTYPVTEIYNKAFDKCSGVTSVSIPNSVTKIGNFAFRDCTGLTTVTIPEGVTTITRKAFGGCTGLTTVNFDAINCTSMSEGQKTLAVFEGCTNLTTIIIGDNVTNIPGNGFYGIASLKTLTIGESVKTIEQWSFEGCTGLETINYNATNCETIGITTRGVFAYTDDGVLYTSVKTVNIGENVESIPARAFKECSAMTTLNFSNAEALETIGNEAFNKCSGLTTVDLSNTEVTTIGNDAFSDCYILDTDSGLTNLDLGNKVTTIGERAFYNNKKISALDLPKSITSIGTFAFYDLIGMVTFTLHKSPDEFSSIGTQAFYNNQAILINDSGTEIAPGTAGYGLMLQSVDIVVVINSKAAIELDNDNPTALPFATVTIADPNSQHPKGNEAATMAWSSSDPTVVQVDENGNVKAIGKGEATITLTCTDHNAKVDPATITFERLAVVANDFIPAGIDSIAADEEGGAAEVYTLQGVKTNERDLAPGIYVRRAGDKATKVLVK
mgnify:FL=1